MATNTSTLMGSRAERLKSVQEFNIRTLKTLNYYGGYTTTEALSLIHEYTKAGVRKRMHSMVKHGWVQKDEQDEGLGRSEQIWCITKSGRCAAQTENDLPIELSEAKGFSLSEYSPALTSHTKAVQVLASKLSWVCGCQEVRPFRMELLDQGESKCIVADIIFDMGVAEQEGRNVSIYTLYEVELTVKPLGYYQDFLNMVDSYNGRLTKLEESYTIGQINFVVPELLFTQLENVLNYTKSDVAVELLNENKVLKDQENLPIGKDLALTKIKNISMGEL